MLPSALTENLKLHIERVKSLHNADLGGGFGEMLLPPALA
mgnify:CR=1 FL=1